MGCLHLLAPASARLGPALWSAAGAGDRESTEEAQLGGHPSERLEKRGKPVSIGYHPIQVEAVVEGLLWDWARVQAGEVDLLFGKHLEHLGQPAGTVLSDQSQDQLDRTHAWRQPRTLAHHQKAGPVAWLVGDVLGHHLEPVALGRGPAGDSAIAWLTSLGDLAGSAGGVGEDDRKDVVFGQPSGALG